MVAVTDVRFGSKADIARLLRDVRFVPKADISRTNQYAPIRRLQQVRHFTHKAFRLRHWREARSHDASLINQELREVPFYAVAQQPALLPPKPNVEGVLGQGRS